MKNGTDVTRDYVDECPVHDTPIRKEYTYGMNDATVITFSGCKCACHRNNWNEIHYFNSYNEAAGKATLSKAQNKW